MGLERLYGALAETIIRRPRGVIAAMAILLVVAAFFSTTIYQQSITEEYIEMDAFDGILYTDYSERLAGDAFILVIQTSDPTTYPLLADLLILEEECSQIEYISSTTSIASVVREANGGVLPHNQETIDAIVAVLPEEARSQLLPDKQMTLAVLNIEQGTPADRKYTIVPAVEETIANADLPPGVSVELTGTIPYNKEFEDAGMASAVVLVVGAFVLMFMVLRVLFSAMRYWFMPIVLLFAGLTYCFGIMGLLGVPMNDGATAAFPILLGLGIDYAVQFHSRFDEERRRGHSVDDAIRATVMHTGPAVVLAMFATSMGFLAIFIVPVPMMQTFASVSLIGVGSCYLASLFGFHAIVKVTGYEPKPVHGALPRLMERYGTLLGRCVGVVTKFAVPVVIVALTLAVSGVLTDDTIPIDTDTSLMGPPDLPAQLTIDKVQNTGTSITPFPLYVLGADLTDLSAVRWIDRFGTYEQEQYSEITSVSSIATLVREYNLGRLPEDQGELDAVLASIPGEKFATCLYGTTESAITFQTVTLPMDSQKALMGVVMDDVGWTAPPPGISVYPTGDFYLYTSLMEKIEANKDRMTQLGFVLIFFFLLFAYRRSVAVTPLFPIVCIVGWNSVAMALIGLHYNPISACLGSMTIGVAAEYTILVMERYIEEGESGGRGLAAITESVRKIGSSVTVSGFVTASGFAALMLSTFPLISSFGLLSVITVLFSVFGAITVMPAVLTLMEKIEERVAGDSERTPYAAVR